MTQIAACDVRRASAGGDDVGRRHEPVAVLVVLVDADAVEARAGRRTRAGPCTRGRARCPWTGSNRRLGMSTQTERCFSRKSSGRYGHGIRLNQVNLSDTPRSPAVDGVPDSGGYRGAACRALSRERSRVCALLLLGGRIVAVRDLVLGVSFFRSTSVAVRDLCWAVLSREHTSFAVKNSCWHGLRLQGARLSPWHTLLSTMSRRTSCCHTLSSRDLPRRVPA